MASTSSVPLMSDVEGQETTTTDDRLEAHMEKDFAYNNNVAGAARHIRMGFLRKVYGLLSLQLGLTTLIAAVCLFTPAIKEAIHENPWLIMVAFFLSLGLLVALHIKRRETPTNFILLAAFVRFVLFSTPPRDPRC